MNYNPALDTEEIYKAFEDLQSKNKWLKEVNLEISSEMPKGGSSGHWISGYKDQPGIIRLFLPALRKNFETEKSRPRAARKQPKRQEYAKQRSTADFTKYVKATLRHEAAHAWHSQQRRIKGIEDEAQTKFTEGRAAYLDDPGHGKYYNILNRMLAGSGSEPVFSKIGLPPLIEQDYWTKYRPPRG